MGDTEDIPAYNVGEELITEPTDMDTHTPDMDTDTTSARDLLMLNQKPTPAQTHGTVMEDTVMAVDTVMVTHIGMVVTTDVVTTDTANKQHQKFQNNISKSTNYEFWIDLFHFRHELINENSCNTFSIFTNLLCNIKRESCTYFKKK